LKDFLVEPGRIVKATAGRDKDRFFMIVNVVDEEYVYISDGDYRKLANPKLKKVKHLKITPVVLATIKEKLIDEKKVFDAELRSAIMKAGFNGGKDERSV